VFGRHTAVIEDDFRVYWAQAGDSPLIAEVLAPTDAFVEAAGRRPRILFAKMGRVMKTGAEWRVRQRPDDGVAPDAGRLVVLGTATTAEAHHSAQPALPAEPLAALAHSAPLLCSQRQHMAALSDENRR